MMMDIIAEGLEFILNEKGQLLKINLSPTVSYSEALIKENTGKSIDQFLSSILKNYLPTFPIDWIKKPYTLFFNPTEKKDNKQYGLLLKGILYEDKIYGSLSPSLGNGHHLEQTSAEEIPFNHAYLTQLFVKFKTTDNRLNHYLNHFPGVVFSQRADGSFAYIHEHFKNWIPQNPNRLLRSTQAFLQLIAEEDRQTYLQYLTQQNKTQQTDTLFYRLHISPEKMIHIMDIRTPQIAPSGLLLGYEGVWLDITRQTIAEKYLEKNSWKEHLALLTSGLLHDFSNIMAGIYSISELYDHQTQQDHPWKQGFSQIQNSAKEAQTLVRRILELHKDIKTKRDYFNLKTLIEQQRDLLKIILPKQTQLNFQFETAEFPVYIDDVRFRQSLVNFAVNTRDALNDRSGTINIQLKKISINQPLGTAFKPHTHCPKEGVLLSFQDNAGGIKPEWLSQIFNPFFTTKESSKGSGLGLYNTKLFVEDMGGLLGVQSTLHEGTCFYIYLPLATFDENDELPATQNILNEKRKRIFIYAYEDPSFFSLVERLQEMGWEVMCHHQPETLISTIHQLVPKPDIIYFIELADDKNLTTLAQSIQAQIPNIPLIKQFMLDDHLNEIDIKKLFHTVIERNTPLNTIIEILNNTLQIMV